MLSADSRVEIVDWSVEDINARALSTFIVLKRGFKTFGSENWDDRSLTRVTSALQYRATKPVYFQAGNFDMWFYGINQPRTLEFDADGFIWRQPAPRFLILEHGLSSVSAERFNMIFKVVAKWANQTHDLTPKSSPKQLQFSSEHFAWGMTDLQNAVPLNTLIRNRQ